MRRIPPKLLVAPFLLSILLIIDLSLAATDSSQINLAVTRVDYVKLTGTVVNASRTFSVQDIKPVGNRRRGPRVELGTLGIESNMPGNCDLEFSTQNRFKLRHIISNKRLTRYRLRYRNKRITRRRNRMTLPCNVINSPLEFQSRGRFRNNVEPGIYRDVVTITVTTQ